MLDPSESLNISPASSKISLLPNHYDLQTEVYQNESRNEVEVEENVWRRIDGQMSRDDIERSRSDFGEGISFDTEDCDISLNSIYQDRNSFDMGRIEEPTEGTPSFSTTYMSDAIKIARDEFLLSITGVDHNTFQRAVLGLPDNILFLAASAFLDEITHVVEAPTPSVKNTRNKGTLLNLTMTEADHEILCRVSSVNASLVVPKNIMV